MVKIVPLNNVTNLLDNVTAQTTLNNNNTSITNAVNNTLSLDGSSPNQMQATLDMNSNQIINLPAPTTNKSPLRMADFVAGAAPVYVGGTNIVVAGTTISTSSNPTFATSVNTPAILGGSAANSSVNIQSTTNVAPSGDVVNVNSSTFSVGKAVGGSGTTINLGIPGSSGAVINVAGPVSGSVQVLGAGSGTVSFPAPAAPDTLVARNTTDTLTNKTLTSPVINTPVIINALIQGIPHTTSVVTTGSHTGGFSANTSGTYTTPANCVAIWVRMVGGGGGGAGSGTGAVGGGAGGQTAFGTSFLTANGGAGGSTAGNGANVAGGLGGGGDIAFTGAAGSTPAASTNTAGGPGGASAVIGVQTNNFVFSTNPGSNAPNNSGSGGSGASCSATVNAGGGGAGAGYTEKYIASPLATYAYTVGSGGSIGGAGTSGAAGGSGASGFISVLEYYV